MMERKARPASAETPRRTETDETREAALVESRRRFLASCGRLAVATPPGVALLLSASEQNFATAFSGATRIRRYARSQVVADDEARCDEESWAGSILEDRPPLHCDEARRIESVNAKARIDGVHAGARIEAASNDR